VDFLIVAKTNLGEFFISKKIPKNGKKISKVLENIKLNKKVMLRT
jgi:hypothetical protein